MNRCIVHRGPDDSGQWHEAPAGFGFRRLAIIDVAHGQQPMANEDGAVHVVFNGEIYNFPELREELIAAGHVFATQSDTECIVHGWEQWGTGLPARLRGMFAFAVWDARARRLFMARDRVGKKPLFYARLRPGAPDEAIAFASELKALLADPDFDRTLDDEALHQYLTYQYVPQPRTIFRGGAKLPPGHWLLWEPGSAGGGEPRVERYWNIDYSPKSALSEDEAVEAAVAHLDDAVRVRLMSEVPLGCFLSGGIDSTLVVAAMRRQISGDLRTFSIGFREASHDELPHARRAAERYGTIHHEFVVEPDAAACLGRLAWHFDEPFADSSALPTFYLAEMARRHVTVALNGDGGDESFAGYSRYAGVAGANRFLGLPAPLRAMAAAGLPLAAAALPGNARLEQYADAARAAAAGPDRLYARAMAMFHPTQRRRLLTDGFLARLAECPGGGAEPESLTVEAMRASGAADPVDRMMAADIALYLPGALLPKVDRMTMAHGVEGRSPFLDTPLMEFAARLPVGRKMPGGELKRLLKRALLRDFPDDFVNRPKQGFGVPLADWFRGPLKPLATELLTDATARARGIFHPATVDRLLHQHATGQADHQYRLWTLLMFEAWARTFLDRSDALAGPVEFGG